MSPEDDYFYPSSSSSSYHTPEKFTTNSDLFIPKLKLTSLYPEILTSIFLYLSPRDKSRLSQVNQYFNQIGKNRQIWKDTQARLNLKPNQIQIHQNLCTRGVTKVQVLSLKRSLRELTSGVKISSLKLSGCYNVTDYSLSSMQNLNNLVDLDLSLCKQITDHSLFSIVGKAPNLMTLDLGGCCNLTDRGILLISYGLRKLKKLDLRSCYNLTDKALAYLSGDVKINERYEIKTYNFLAKIGLIENPNCMICKRGNRKINLPKIDENTEFGMQNLEALVLQDCQKISDLSLQAISKISSIKILNLSFCVNITDNGLKYLRNNENSQIKELNLRSCDNISDSGLINLRDCAIEHLDVSFCEKVTTLNQFVCRNLKTLSLSACDVNDEAFLNMGVGMMRELVTLNLGQCGKVTDKGLEAIAEKCQNLKYIDLYGCSGISTKGLEAIMKLPKLKNVNLGLWKI